MKRGELYRVAKPQEQPVQDDVYAYNSKSTLKEPAEMA